MAAQRFVKRFEDRRTEPDLAGRVTWALADCTANAKDAAASAIKHDLFPDIAAGPLSILASMQVRIEALSRLERTAS
jgi:hypothetical protein